MNHWLYQIFLMLLFIEGSFSLPFVINETAIPETSSNLTIDNDDAVSSAYRKDYVFEVAGDDRDSDSDEPSDDDESVRLVGRKQYEDGDEEPEDRSLSDEFQNGMGDDDDEQGVDLSRPEQERDSIATSRDNSQQQQGFQDPQLMDRATLPYDSRDDLQMGDGNMRNMGEPIEQFDGSPGLRPEGEFVGLRPKSPFMEEGFFDSFYNKNPSRENIPRSPRIMDEGGNQDLQTDNDLRSNYNSQIVYEDDGEDDDEDEHRNSMIARTLGKRRMSDYDEIIVDRGDDGEMDRKRK